MKILNVILIYVLGFGVIWSSRFFGFFGAFCVIGGLGLLAVASLYAMFAEEKKRGGS